MEERGRGRGEGRGEREERGRGRGEKERQKGGREGGWRKDIHYVYTKYKQIQL